MKKTLIIVLIVTSACGVHSDFWTSHGVGVYQQGITEVTPEIMELATEFYIQNLKYYDPEEVEESIDQVVVRWETKPFDCTLVTGQQLCNGTRFRYIVRAVWTDNICDSAYFHELTHWVLDDFTGDGDAGHLDPIWDHVDHRMPEICRKELENV